MAISAPIWAPVRRPRFPVGANDRFRLKTCTSRSSALRPANLSERPNLPVGHEHRRPLVYVKVDLQATPPSVSLEDAANWKQFHVLAAGAGEGDDQAVAAALEAASAGRASATPGHVYVAVDRVRSMAGDAGVGPSWEDEFSGMLKYAATKGWLDD